MSKGKVIKHQQINFHGKLSINTEHIQYVQKCKPYGNEQLSKSQLKIKLHDTDKIYVNLGVTICNLYYGIVDSILSGKSLTKEQKLLSNVDGIFDEITIDDVKEIM